MTGSHIKLQTPAQDPVFISFPTLKPLGNLVPGPLHLLQPAHSLLRSSRVVFSFVVKVKGRGVGPPDSTMPCPLRSLLYLLPFDSAMRLASCFAHKLQLSQKSKQMYLCTLASRKLPPVILGKRDRSFSARLCRVLAPPWLSVEEWLPLRGSGSGLGWLLLEGVAFLGKRKPVVKLPFQLKVDRLISSNPQQPHSEWRGQWKPDNRWKGRKKKERIPPDIATPLTSAFSIRHSLASYKLMVGEC